MTKIVAALVAGIALAAVAAPSAPAASPTDRKVAALQRQVNALQAQVKVLTTRVNRLNSSVGGAFLGSTCAVALTADLFQGTWAVIDQVAGRTIFGPQTQLNDYGNCAYMREPSVPRPPITIPPRASVFSPLLQWLYVPIS